MCFVSIGANYWRNRIIKVAKKFKGKVMNYVIASKQEFSGQLTECGIEDVSKNKVYAAIRNEAGGKFVMNDDEKFR